MNRINLFKNNLHAGELIRTTDGFEILLKKDFLSTNKNISLLQPGISSPHQLSPAYDIVCTALYGDHKMALMFDGKNQNLKRKNFIEFGKRYNIPEKATMSMLNKLVEKFQKHHHLFFSFPAAIKKQKFLNQFFDQRLTHLS